jgi:hypothetical protein
MQPMRVFMFDLERDFVTSPSPGVLASQTSSRGQGPTRPSRNAASNFRFRVRYKRGLGRKSSLQLHAAVDLRLPLVAIS